MTDTTNTTKKEFKKPSSKNKLARIQKIIADSGLCSRRNAEALIEAGRVKVNGEYAEIGQSANPNKDTILVDDQPLEIQQKRYIMMYKPFDVHTTTKDPYANKTVITILENANIKERLYPVGRLDKNASGLLLLTNDGDWANNVIHPSIGFEKEYLAKTSKPLSKAQIAQVRKGIMLSDGPVQAVITPQARGSYSLTLKAGRHKIVKRIFKYFDIHVTGLKRVRIGPYKLGSMKIGECKEINPDYLKQTADKRRTVSKSKADEFKKYLSPKEKIKDRMGSRKTMLADRENARKLTSTKRIKKPSPKIDVEFTRIQKEKRRNPNAKREPRISNRDTDKFNRGDHRKETKREFNKRNFSDESRRDYNSKGNEDRPHRKERSFSASSRDRVLREDRPARHDSKDHTERKSNKSNFKPFDKNKTITSKPFQERLRDSTQRGRPARKSNASSSTFTPFDRTKVKVTDFKETRDPSRNKDRVAREKRAPIDQIYDEPQTDKNNSGPRRLHVAISSKPFDKNKMMRKVGKKRDPLKPKKGAKKRWT